jgi:hypothetical protein
MNTKSAKGVKGFIMRTFDGGNGSYVFRVYERGAHDKIVDFTDYDILHYDLEVEILDDAILYDDGKRQFIDYKDER